MPTAEDFRRGVSDVDREITNIVWAQRACDRYVEDFGFTGGVAGTVKDSFTATSGNAAKVGTLVDALRDEMNRKARLCDQYTTDMGNHAVTHARWAVAMQTYLDTRLGLRADLWPGSEPAAPVPPFEGAEVSP